MTKRDKGKEPCTPSSQYKNYWKKYGRDLEKYRQKFRDYQAQLSVYEQRCAEAEARDMTVERCYPDDQGPPTCPIYPAPPDPFDYFLDLEEQLDTPSPLENYILPNDPTVDEVVEGPSSSGTVAPRPIFSVELLTDEQKQSLSSLISLAFGLFWHSLQSGLGDEIANARVQKASNEGQAANLQERLQDEIRNRVDEKDVSEVIKKKDQAFEKAKKKITRRQIDIKGIGWGKKSIRDKAGRALNHSIYCPAHSSKSKSNTYSEQSTGNQLVDAALQPLQEQISNNLHETLGLSTDIDTLGAISTILTLAAPFLVLLELGITLDSTGVPVFSTVINQFTPIGAGALISEVTGKLSNVEHTELVKDFSVFQYEPAFYRQNRFRFAFLFVTFLLKIMAQAQTDELPFPEPKGE